MSAIVLRDLRARRPHHIGHRTLAEGEVLCRMQFRNADDAKFFGNHLRWSAFEMVDPEAIAEEAAKVAAETAKVATEAAKVAAEAAETEKSAKAAAIAAEKAKTATAVPAAPSPSKSSAPDEKGIEVDQDSQDPKPSKSSKPKH